MNPLYVTTEQHPENENAVAVTVYFEQEPTAEELLALAQRYDNVSEFRSHPTVVSRLAKLYRYQLV